MKESILCAEIELKVSIQTLLLQICEKIPENTIKPQKRLAAVFEVMKKHTGIDIHDIYRNMNRKSLESLDVKNIILFLCAASDSSLSNTFNIFPRDVILEIISKLKMQPFVSWENNGVYHLLLELLEGYCGFNRTIPEHLERYHLKAVREIIHAQHASQKGLFRNAGGLLFQLFTAIPPEEIRPDDGLHHVFIILQNYAGISISEFDKDSPLIKFFTRNRDCIEYDSNFYACWISMILKSKFASINPAQDIPLLLSHPYFSATGKNGMINSLINYGDRYYTGSLPPKLNVCRELIASSQQELVYSFLTALRNKKYNIAMYLLRKANNINMSDTFFSCLLANNELEVCYHLLLSLLNIIDEGNNPRLLSELLDYASTIKEEDQLSFFAIIIAYEKLLTMKDSIPEWEVMERKFVRCFIPDVNDFFYYLLTERSHIEPLATYLLEANTSGIYVKENRLAHIRTHGTSTSYFLVDTLGPYLSSSWKIDANEKIMSLLQASIQCFPFDKQLLPFIKALIAYDRQCLFQKDSHGNDIIHYLENLDREYSCSNRSERKTQRCQEICRFIRAEYLALCKVSKSASTFFSSKYDPDSLITQLRLPENVVSDIASLTIK
jgi:hypothetical protein